MFNDVDIILTPTSKSTAFPISAVNDPIAMYNNDIFTVPSSLAGVPAMGTLLALIFLGETPGIFGILGVAIITPGILIVALTKSRGSP